MNKNLKIYQIPKDERPREKLLNKGVKALTDAELLALLLRTGTKDESALELSDRLLKTVNGVGGIFHTPVETLMKIKGIKEAKASQLIAACELYERAACEKRNSMQIKSARDVVSVLEHNFFKDTQEVVRLLCLNTKNNIISTKEVFKGSLNSSIVHPREIFKEAIHLSAASIILCHNHPSGDPTPSIEDINITKRIKSCGEIIGIELLDHVILGKNNFISLKEKGII
ncbi:MAG: RadC family protein [Sarcina sp.]